MPGITMENAIEQILNVLDETFVHQPKPWTYFTDNKPDAGIIGMLSTLNADDASANLAGTSIAAHAHHIIFSLKESAEWIRGDRSQRDWSQSWSISKVDQAQWSQMQKEMLSSFEDLKNAIKTGADSDIEAFGGTAGILAHMAFHLGAIRQKVALLRT